MKAGRLDQLTALAAEFQRFADLHPWVRLELCFHSGYVDGILGAPTGPTPLTNFGVPGVASPKFPSNQSILDHLEDLSFRAQRLLLGLLTKNCPVPDDIQLEIRACAGLSQIGGWIRWVMYATRMRCTVWIDNYAQVAATALAYLKDCLEVDRPAHIGHTASGPEMLSCADLAERYDVELETLRGRLRRWMLTHQDDWKEVTDRRPRDPKYLYRVSAVLPVITNLKTSGERPAK